MNLVSFIDNQGGGGDRLRSQLADHLVRSRPVRFPTRRPVVWLLPGLPSLNAHLLCSCGEFPLTSSRLLILTNVRCFLMKPAPLFQIVLYREEEVLECECDMAMVHHLLSQIPQDLPYETLISRAGDLFVQFPPSELAREVASHDRYLTALSTAVSNMLGYMPPDD